jgi:hypothetical protein
VRTLKDWEREYANRIVDSINTLRERRKWTIPRLREELASNGWSVSVETLNGILSARKRGAFSVGEIFAFARALDVSPLYLMNGLPASDPLPEGPLLPDSDVVSTYEWLFDSQQRILDGSAIGFMPEYAKAVSLAKWHNALWLASDGRYGKEYLAQDIAEIARLREQWREYDAPRWNVPKLPPLPDALAGLDDGPSRLPTRSAPWVELSGDAWMQTARDYVSRMDARRAELDRLENAGRGPTDSFPDHRTE